jgi:hypothetical protein
MARKKEEKKLPTLVPIYIFNNGITPVINLRQHYSFKYVLPGVFQMNSALATTDIQ